MPLNTLSHSPPATPASWVLTPLSVALLLLALTSNRYSQRRLGLRWRQLHRAIYFILVLALLHMLWVVRSDIGEWLLYALAGAFVLLSRVPRVAEGLSAVRAR